MVTSGYLRQRETFIGPTGVLFTSKRLPVPSRGDPRKFGAEWSLPLSNLEPGRGLDIMTQNLPHRK
jgi:hypothetical protein